MSSSRDAVIGGLLGLAAAAILTQSVALSVLLAGFLIGGVLGAIASAVAQATRPVDDSRHFEEIISDGGAVIGVPVNPADEATVREILSDCQHGLLDSSWYEGAADANYVPFSTSAARTASTDKAGSDSRIRSSRLP